MAVSTHRWRPDANVKSGYSLRKKVLKPKSTRNKDNCTIQIKFENSAYFAGVSYPVNTVFKASKTSDKQSLIDRSIGKTSIGKVSTGKTSVGKSSVSKTSVAKPSIVARKSSIVFDGTIHDFIHKKLYASEYAESGSIKTLSKLKDPLVRAYIIADDPLFLEDAINCAELIKLNLDEDTWISFRILIIAKRCDVRLEILRTEPKVVVQQKTFAMKPKVEVESEEDKNDVEEIDADEDDLDNESGTTYDDDEETRMIGKIANSKFRDSRIILTNKKKITVQPTIDPIERCFTALMKMMEDNIFSASKGLNELNSQIGHMMKESDIDSTGIDSDESNDTRVSNI